MPAVTGSTWNRTRNFGNPTIPTLGRSLGWGFFKWNHPMPMKELTAERLRDLLHYAAETGMFTWKHTRCARAKAGQRAGCKNDKRYIIIRVDGRIHLAHRLAWLYVHGVWPKDQIDHINGVTIGSRICAKPRAAKTSLTPCVAQTVPDLEEFSCKGAGATKRRSGSIARSFT
jgi:HNH endonuclease